MIEILYKCDGSERLREIRWQIGEGELPVICDDLHTLSFIEVSIKGDEMNMVRDVLGVYGITELLDAVKFVGVAAKNLYASLMIEQYTVGWGRMEKRTIEVLKEYEVDDPFRAFCEELDEREF